MSSFLARRTVFASASVARAFTTSAPKALAKVTLIGHLSASPEVSTTSKPETELVRYTVACNNGHNKPASWFRVTAFASPEDVKKKEWIQGLPKGTLVYIEGEITIQTYSDEEGKNRQSINVLQRTIEVLKRPKTEETTVEN